MDAELKSLIQAIATDALGPAVVVDVHVRPEADADDEPILRTHIIVNMPKGGGVLPSEKTMMIPRAVRNALVHRGIDAFPIVSFISKAEAAGLSSEAA
ncbi:hypothetical protein X907_0911 [Glycocaulis alkaliphilus]|uniref:Uncharacterized protein n=1 Tax=Glycocaulis alkaliphilus TaxID=1434191 RepID=A0A3T0E801_9PROT|nr:hypothetical protein [Glycocaulis alkaliphilus]AZU03452.1 hypothetical protein X907_0911 [Glycocaulis alkaliphilus]GGB73602.1 hypothetical protein GCM10007417_11850 [Glycocaulis alkaliphilus]